MEKFLASKHTCVKYFSNPSERAVEDFLNSIDGAVIHSITQSTTEMGASFGTHTIIWIVYTAGPSSNVFSNKEEQS